MRLAGVSGVVSPGGDTAPADAGQGPPVMDGPWSVATRLR